MNILLMVFLSLWLLALYRFADTKVMRISLTLQTNQRSILNGSWKVIERLGLTLESWKKNLLIICIAEFTVLMGFGFCMPFIPLYIQQLGNYTPEQASLWAGIATGGSGIAMFLSAPLWGLVADRFGRKPMVLRAQFGAGLVVALMGLSTSILQVSGLRVMQGILAGTVPAATALAAAQTPRERLTFSMAMVLLSVQLGNMFGPVFGGFMADHFSIKLTFFIAAALLVSGGFAVLFLVKEKFVRPEQGKAGTLKDMFHLAFSRQMLPLLIVMCAINIGPQMIGPIIPLLINSISHQGEAASSAGITFAIMGGFTAIAAFVTSRIARRVPLIKIIIFCCIGT